MKENSYGVIPLRRDAGEWFLFLILHRAGHWAFPKGRPEEGETALQSASRELEEETSLKITDLLSETPFQEQYQFIRDDQQIEKTVTYFLAEVEGSPKLQQEELTDGKWVKLSEASTLLTFPEAQKLCKQVISFLEDHQ